ncbi:MAG TPA: hypothetical protein VLB44_13195 [Kofleriaceae bacterium]|nr:hypothetical protein [Kofleriaceae bacterium]
MITRIAVAAAFVVAAPHMVRSARADDDCPEAFRGAAITTAPIRDGVALTFTTAADRLELMRDELREVAMMLEQKGTEVQTASYDEDVEFPPVDLDVKDIDGGARVRVRASRPRDIPELRELAKTFELYWQTSSCHGDEVAKAPATRRMMKPEARRTREARR